MRESDDNDDDNDNDNDDDLHYNRCTVINLFHTKTNGCVHSISVKNGEAAPALPPLLSTTTTTITPLEIEWSMKQLYLKKKKSVSCKCKMFAFIYYYKFFFFRDITIFIQFRVTFFSLHNVCFPRIQSLLHFNQLYFLYMSTAFPLSLCCGCSVQHGNNSNTFQPSVQQPTSGQNESAIKGLEFLWSGPNRIK